MEINRFRRSSNGLFSRSGSEVEITPETHELQTQLRATAISDDSQRSYPSLELEEKIFVAVGKVFKESKSVLNWALQNLPRSKKFVLLHVHCPDKMIPMGLGGKFPASQLSAKQLDSHRQTEREEMNKVLRQYLDICAREKVRGETLVIETDDVANGLLELIRDRGITNLVMGAASDGNYSRKMKSPSSKKAKTVQQKAALPCRISFVCKENLICVREADLRDSVSPSTSSTASLSPSQSNSTIGSWAQYEISSAVQEERVPRGSSTSPSLAYEGVIALAPPSPQLENIAESLYPADLQEETYSRLRRALEEAERSKKEAYEESSRRMRAEIDALEATRRVKLLESMQERQSKQRREAEEALSRQRGEADTLRAENVDYLQKLGEAHRERSALEAQLAQLEDKLDEAHFLISSLQEENQELSLSSSNSSLEAPGFSVFTYEELDQATRRFNSSLKIGEGGYGTVYKGTLRHTTVAIKRLHSHGIQGQNEFHHEVEVLRRVTHPNLVTLIGVCPEAWCLVYEYLPNGSLEDCLACKNNSAPLPWQSRLRIMADICSALIFLHSSKPHGIVHGDLKPANVLLDSGFVCKLGDFGLSRLLSHSSSSSSSSASLLLCHRTEMPKGTIEYMDPEILVTGELTVGSDVYSLGVIILRLLTGRSAQRIVRDVEEALENNAFHRMLDQSAGSWPFVQAKQLAHLALQCCAMTRRSRPDLANGVWRILLPMLNAAFSRPVSTPTPLHASDDDSHVPSQFLCPIFQEVMIDPQVAADGYTYEGEALRGWFEGGNHTSPMTNLVLPHQQLIPNHSLRSAIQEWLQLQHHRQQENP